MLLFGMLLFDMLLFGMLLFQTFLVTCATHLSSLRYERLAGEGHCQEVNHLRSLIIDGPSIIISKITDYDIFAITNIIITNIMSNLCEESRHNVLLVGGALSAKTWVAFLCHSQVQHLPKVWICFGFLFFFFILSI